MIFGSKMDVAGDLRCHKKLDKILGIILSHEYELTLNSLSFLFVILSSARKLRLALPRPRVNYIFFFQNRILCANDLRIKSTLTAETDRVKNIIVRWRVWFDAQYVRSKYYEE